MIFHNINILRKKKGRYGMSDNKWSKCNNSFCSSLNNETRESFCEIKRSVHFKGKQEFCLERNTVSLITNGNLIVFRARRDGKRQGIEFLHKGDLLGITSLFSSKTNINEYDISIYTKSKGGACNFPLQKFEALCLLYPDAAIASLKNIVHRFGVVIKQLDHVSLDKSEDRILNLLNLLLEEDISDFPDYNLPFSHEEIAMFAGLNRVTATRAIDKLKKKGIFTAARCNIRAVRKQNSAKKYKLL